MYILSSLIEASGVWLTFPFTETMTFIFTIGLIKLSNKNLALEITA